uniref:CSON009724 protein n=1 Tax=Culicoides sonorensis TaxID=179676 RepID=A0A336LXR4_CULSO
MIVTFLIFTILGLIFYKYVKYRQSYWKRKGIKGPEPTFFVGHFFSALLQKDSFLYEQERYYRQYKDNNSVIGVYSFLTPQLMILNSEVAREVLVKSFKNFHINGFEKMLNEKSDPLLAYNPFFLTGDAWKDKRSEITPAFSPARIKAMYPLIESVCTKLVDFLEMKSKNNELIEGRDLCSRYTCDVVTNCIFSADAQSFKDENPKIRDEARKIFGSGLFTMLKLTVMEMFPSVSKILRIGFVPKESETFFRDLMRQAIEYRLKNNINNQDYLDFLLQMKEKKGLSDLEVAASGITFLTDGLDTSSVAIAHILFEIANNKEVQSKLRQEINEVYTSKGNLDYDTLVNLPYLEQVFHESLRLHPPAGFTARECTESIEIDIGKEKKFLVEKGTAITIPIWAMHYDPNIYDEPEKFKPERFNDGALKAYKDKSQWLVFGDGPRVCLGQRFAKAQSKACIAAVVTKDSDPLMGRNPFFLKGEEWREKRGEILPAFTSGRIKALFPIMQEVSNRMKTYINKNISSNPTIETVELCGKYTTDVVASSIYGVESGAFTDENSRIREVARNVFAPSLRSFFLMTVAPYFPQILNLIKVRLVPEADANFLVNLLKDAVSHRKTNNIQRQDYLDFLINLREKKGLSDLEVAAHTVTFFFDGIETSKGTLSNIFYELARYRSVQEKLRQELIKIRSHDGTFEYDTLMENKYLEQVINESLRIHPVLAFHNRECTKECTLQIGKGKTLKVEKGTNILLPVYSFSRDSDHYGSDSEQFNPDRFNEENGGLKAYKDKEVLFPFGDGPRICLGQRFALAQMKCCIAHMITNFEISLSEKMPSKPELDTNQVLLCYKGGIWLKNFKLKAPVIGVYNGLKPFLIVTHPSLARKIMINDFSHFTDTLGTLSIDKEIDPLIGNNPFFLRGDEWKNKRGEISPAFSNARIKSLFPWMQVTAIDMIKFLKASILENPETEMREMCAKFTANVIASSLFRVNGDEFSQKSSCMRNISKNVLRPSFRLVFMLVFSPFIPWIAKLFKIKLCQKEEETFLKKLYKEAVQKRNNSNEKRQDFLEYLIQLQEKKSLSETEMTAHTLSFFLDGVETSSIALANIFYELALNTKCQEKLRKEMLNIRNEENKFDFETLNENKYLEHVIFESLRLHPIMNFLYRQCTKDYELEVSDHDKVTIEKGTGIGIAVYDIQRDPEFFGADSEKFNPDRFDVESGGIKEFADKGFLFPFGDGPRICLGKRLAKVQLKCCIAHIVTSFKLKVSKNMPKKPKYDTFDILLSYKSGVPGPVPRILIGTFPSLIDKRIHNLDEVSKLYKEYKGNTKAIGTFIGVSPTLLVIDPDLAKKIMITDFSHFTDVASPFQIDKEIDPLVGRNPFFLKGEEWREKRAEIIPAFTSGRIKALFPIMQEVANRMKIYINNQIRIENYLEMRELSAKYTTDVVASSIYGVESGAFSGEKSEIRDAARNVLSPSLRMFCLLSLSPLFPWLKNIIKVKLCPDKEANFLVNLLNEALKYRKQNNVERQDYLDFLIHLREKKGLSDVEIAAHTLSFFFDGIETSSITLSNIFYELAKNKKHQDKLRQEMVKIRGNDGKFEYESLTENKFLEQVILETMRLTPVLHVHFRECTKSYETEIIKGDKVTIDKGTQIQLAIYEMARDKEYYGSDANEFNPERFNEDRGGFKPYTDKGVLFPFVAVVYFYLTHNYGYWKKRGIEGPKPKILVGNYPSTFNKKVHNIDEIDEIYKTYKGKESVVGVYRGVSPELMILDPEIARNFMTTNFKHFQNPGNLFGDFNKDCDPLAGRNPFFLKGEEWKEKRAEILPAFSSGRIKALLPIMNSVVENMKQYIETQMENEEYLETRELCAKYTTDVVCNSIYGIDSGAFTEEKSPLRDVARNVLSPSWRLFLIMGFSPALPFLKKIVRVRFVPEHYANFLTDLLNKTIQYRKENNVDRQDFVDYLIHLKEKKGISDVETAAHTVTFFFDGIETSSITMSYVFYELAKHKQVQNKLRELLNEIKKEDGNFDYDALMDHKYLDQVLIEAMRLHPVLPLFTRECTEDYDLELPENKTLKIEKGMTVGWPVSNIFQDPEYYGPTADQFDPERFNEENGGMKMYKDRGVLFPFGDGPRVCLGQRFAQTQMKIGIAQIVTSFDISLSDKMPENPKLNPNEMMLCFYSGILLKFRTIKQ